MAEVLISEGGGPGNSLHSWRCEYPDRYGPCDCVAETVRELWDAVVEGLGLTEEERGCTHGGFHMRPVEGFTSVYTSVGATCDSVACARLVSRWEPQP